MNTWKTEEPLHRDREHGIPTLYPALGACYFLDALKPEHAPQMEAAHALLVDWLGGSLRWTHNSAFPLLERFRLEDLSYAAGFLRLLDTRTEGLPDEARIPTINMRASFVQDFSIDCHGAEQETASSPFQYRLSATIGDDPIVGPYLPSRICLRFMVPATWPLDDFRQKALALAKALPLRWANAGLTYAGWELCWYEEVESAIYAHARRYPGFDIGQDAILMNELFTSMRTVSWLNVIGPALRERLEKKQKAPTSTDLVEVWQDGPNLVLQAGEAPEAGDINRLQIPRSYLQADEMLRPVRLGRGVNFFDDWDETTTGDWLTRFERRMS